jgi:dihydroorotate dehydrogenase
MNGYRFLRPFLFQQDPETIHERALAGLERTSRSSKLLSGLHRLYDFEDERLRVRLFGQSFDNPLGIAAGLDKNGIAVPALRALGFAYVEVGTVTPQPQPGNDRPRLFRLKEDVALINRLGFPSEGVDEVARNLAGTFRANGYLGLNVGPNKTSVEEGTADADCVAVIERLVGFPGYIVINVSSPNTARLRLLQGKEALEKLLSGILAGKPIASRQPILVKIAPDLSEQELDDILDVVTSLGLDGIVATNTTISRPPSLRGEAKEERGGLSGKPLRELSREIVRRVYRKTEGKLPIIAAGGIFTGQDAYAAIASGASLVQTYTGFIYRGPATAKKIKQELVAELERTGVPSLDDLRGRNA